MTLFTVEVRETFLNEHRHWLWRIHWKIHLSLIVILSEMSFFDLLNDGVVKAIQWNRRLLHRRSVKGLAHLGETGLLDESVDAADLMLFANGLALDCLL